jgi:hypothetical protein
MQRTRPVPGSFVRAKRGEQGFADVANQVPFLNGLANGGGWIGALGGLFGR